MFDPFGLSPKIDRSAVGHGVLNIPIIIYNFEVSDFHAYYITDTGETRIIYDSIGERLPKIEVERNLQQELHKMHKVVNHQNTRRM